MAVHSVFMFHSLFITRSLEYLPRGHSGRLEHRSQGGAGPHGTRERHPAPAPGKHARAVERRARRSPITRAPATDIQRSTALALGGGPQRLLTRRPLAPRARAQPGR